MFNNQDRASRELYAQDYQRASYFWEAESSSGLVMREFEVLGSDVPVTAIQFEKPFMLWARPFRPTDFPAVNILIGPGCSIIWEHQVNWSLASNEETEALIFGCLAPVGDETNVLKIYHTGEHFVFTGDSGEIVLEGARKHVHLPALPRM